jgi:hypothetical protein
MGYYEDQKRDNECSISYTLKRLCHFVLAKTIPRSSSKYVSIDDLTLQLAAHRVGGYNLSVCNAGGSLDALLYTDRAVRNPAVWQSCRGAIVDGLKMEVIGVLDCQCKDLDDQVLVLELTLPAELCKRLTTEQKDVFDMDRMTKTRTNMNVSLNKYAKPVLEREVRSKMEDLKRELDVLNPGYLADGRVMLGRSDEHLLIQFFREHTPVYVKAKVDLEREIRERIEFERPRRKPVDPCVAFHTTKICTKQKCQKDHFRTGVGIFPEISEISRSIDISTSDYPKFKNLECQGTDQEKIDCKASKSYCCFHALDVPTQLAAVYSQYTIVQPIEACDITALCGITRNCSVFDEPLRSLCVDCIAPSRNFVCHLKIAFWNGDELKQPTLCFDGTRQLLELRGVEMLADFDG